MNQKNYRDTTALPSEGEKENRSSLLKLFDTCPLPKEELLDNLGLFIRRQNLTKILLMQELYTKILDVHGIVVEFGTRWGQNLVLFESLRGLYEPFNHNRKILGFDTFAGFPAVHAKDGPHHLAAPGNLSVPQGFENYLEQLLLCHEQESPIAHIRKFELIKGDAVQTAPAYFKAHPETIVALAFFDFDLYEPTKACLEAIRSHLTKGSILAFDELNCSHFPGETLALAEVFGLDRFALKRLNFGTLESYLVIE